MGGLTTSQRTATAKRSLKKPSLAARSSTPLQPIAGGTGGDEDGKPQFKLRVLKARSNTVDLGTVYVFNGNEEDHLSFKGFGDRVVSLDELKTKPGGSLVAPRWQAEMVCACVSDFFGWNGSRYADNVLFKLYEQRCGVDCVAMPSTGGRRKYAYFSVLGGEGKSDFPTASTPHKTGQKPVWNWTSKELSHTSYSS